MLWLASPGGAVSWQVPQSPVEATFQTGVLLALPPRKLPWQYVLLHWSVPPAVLFALNV